MSGPVESDTIVAIATPAGPGGIGIIRLSGSLAHAIASVLTKSEVLKPRYASVKSFQTQAGEVIDTGLVLYFRAPHSFTGEDVVELHAHGSPIVLNQLVSACVVLGARLATPGEFSLRAFLNGKLDLTQAEAIAGLIEARTETASRLATRSLQGDFSKQIKQLNHALLDLRLHTEAAIDFPEEEIDFLSDGRIELALNGLIVTLEAIQETARQGMLLQEGATVVIAGYPNAGKSTLMNALSGHDVAIVTAVPGTTRDVMREQVVLDGIPLLLIDTAGLRVTDDLVEQEGIRRARRAIQHADCVLLVIDGVDARSSHNGWDEIASILPEKIPCIRVFNKIDQHHTMDFIEDGVYLSAKTGEGIDVLKTRIKSVLGYQETEGVFFARKRHLDALTRAHALLLSGKNQLTQHRAGELLADDLLRAHQVLAEITGEFTSDDLLGAIFSSFCIGK